MPKALIKENTHALVGVQARRFHPGPGIPQNDVLLPIIPRPAQNRVRMVGNDVAAVILVSGSVRPGRHGVHGLIRDAVLADDAPQVVGGIVRRVVVEAGGAGELCRCHAWVAT